ncbi:hypothetical protein AWC20_10020 [Mycobacterium parmense]|nr:hypothetical protein AWC20_10020 [Mycobacterium parmense]
MGTDGPTRRRRSASRAALLAVLLAMIGAGGFLRWQIVTQHPSAPTTAPSALSADEPVPPGLLPPGALGCKRIQTDVRVPFNAGARGTPTTSCAFVEQVRKEYSVKSTPTSGPAELQTVSPATFKWYKLACFSSGTFATCTGGAAAVVYLYNRPAN